MARNDYIDFEGKLWVNNGVCDHRGVQLYCMSTGETVYRTKKQLAEEFEFV